MDCFIGSSVIMVLGYILKSPYLWEMHTVIFIDDVISQIYLKMQHWVRVYVKQELTSDEAG